MQSHIDVVELSYKSSLEIFLCYFKVSQLTCGSINDLFGMNRSYEHPSDETPGFLDDGVFAPGVLFVVGLIFLDGVRAAARLDEIGDRGSRISPFISVIFLSAIF